MISLVVLWGGANDDMVNTAGLNPYRPHPQPLLASPPTPLQGERGVISLVALWGDAKDGMVSNGVFRPLVLPI